jgi:leucyl aminopeptidase (aminopeptidase T)
MGGLAVQEDSASVERSSVVVDSPLHIDLIFRNPTVTVDDKVLVKDGKVVV